MRSEAIRSAAASGALFVTLACAATTAGAQTAPESDSNANAGGLEEVVVTAQRREESVQRSSLAIAVVSSDALRQAGVTQAAELASIVPGLSISMAGAAVQTYIRGVGNTGTDANAESAIAYSINGVYISRPSGIGPIFFDLDRVEVLKGPQGTLYGRNASGGAINLITRRPTLGKFGGNVEVEGGDFDRMRVNGAVDIPFGDTFAVRVAGEKAKRDGYLSDGYNDQDTLAGRLVGLWRPNEDASLLVTTEYTDIDDQGAAAVRRGTRAPNPSDPWEGPSAADQQPPTAAIPGGTPILDDGHEKITLKAASAELNWDLQFATLTFLPAYRHMDYHALTYTPGFRFDTFETSNQRSAELRLANQSDTLKWVGGAYYFDEDQTQNYNLFAVPIQRNNNNGVLSTQAWAVFGEATYSITQPLRFIAGVRYSEDDKTQGGATTAFLPAPGGTTNLAGARTFTATTWRTGFEYDVAPNSMLFLTAATGYKAGGFFPAAAPFNSFDPEKLTAFTLGSRNRFADNRLQVNAEGFYWDYKDKQERYLSALPSGSTTLVTTNAGKATLYGLDLDVMFQATSNDRISASVEYLHTRYDDFAFTAYNSATPGGAGALNFTDPISTACRLGTPADYPLTPNIPGFYRDSLQPIDCSGEPLIKAAEWSGSAAYEHHFNLPNSAGLLMGADLTFSSSYYLTPDFISTGQEGGYTLTNAHVTYVSTSGKWSVTGWVRNIGNEDVYTGGFRYPFSSHPAQGGDPSLFYTQIREPRTYGLRARVEF